MDNSASSGSGAARLRIKASEIGGSLSESQGGLNQLQKLVAAGMLAALTTVATLLVQIQLPAVFQYG